MAVKRNAKSTPARAVKATAKTVAPAAAGYSSAQVARHDTLDDAWVSIDGAVYDITHWIRKHPGGSIPLAQYAGRDMTDAFRAYHGPDGKAAKVLKSYYVGDLVRDDAAASDDDAVSDAGSTEDFVDAVSRPASKHAEAFRELVAGLEDEFHTDYVHYYKLFACLSALFASAVYCVVGEGHGAWVHMLGAVLLGMFWQQTMFIGHDAGHGADERGDGRRHLHAAGRPDPAARQARQLGTLYSRGRGDRSADPARRHALPV